MEDVNPNQITVDDFTLLRGLQDLEKLEQSPDSPASSRYLRICVTLPLKEALGHNDHLKHLLYQYLHASIALTRKKFRKNYPGTIEDLTAERNKAYDAYEMYRKLSSDVLLLKRYKE